MMMRLDRVRCLARNPLSLSFFLFDGVGVGVDVDGDGDGDDDEKGLRVEPLPS